MTTTRCTDVLCAWELRGRLDLWLARHCHHINHLPPHPPIPPAGSLLSRRHIPDNTHMTQMLQRLREIPVCSWEVKGQAMLVQQPPSRQVKDSAPLPILHLYSLWNSSSSQQRELKQHVLRQQRPSAAFQTEPADHRANCFNSNCWNSIRHRLVFSAPTTTRLTCSTHTRRNEHETRDERRGRK